ncbi:endolytic transglycosylase MltG [uncultured Oscillibacter sp.]|uniref:endolytic transglycosylase MltG n=1 Tax=uncultured Oscillibacter sp. TaxID=876091 RepID=UPI0025ED81C6|nr:endolytic transglycosylase MltG [uncultured Oscillibacter sp.]
MADFNKSDTASWDAGQVRREQPSRPPQRRRRRRRRRMNPFLFILLHLIFVALASALLGCAGWLLFSDFCSFNRSSSPTVETIVEVSAEDTVDTVADKLKQAGLIEYTWFFKLYANVTGAEEKIGMGSHALNTDMDYHALVLGMRSAAGSMTEDTVRVTIPEGYTVAQTIALLAKNGVNTEAALTAAAQTADFDYSFIDNESEDISRLEGYLFPDTYDFYVGEKPENALGRLLRNFNSKIDDELLEAQEAKGHDLRAVITVASLIERETDGSDHSRIASVIYNRLDGPGDKAGTNGLLQVDASLLYGLPGHEGAITQEDLQTDTPYNLYLHAGLPPTPIANPGLDAIEAALEPEETNYYYYALGTDGSHHFFETYQEHAAFVAGSGYGG